MYLRIDDMLEIKQTKTLPPGRMLFLGIRDQSHLIECLAQNAIDARLDFSLIKRQFDRLKSWLWPFG